MFSIVTIAWSTSTPTESARPPSVIRLSVSPRICRMITELRIDSGMVSAITSVLRQLPRNSSTSAAVRPAAISASVTTPTTAALTKIDWSNSVLTEISLGICAAAVGSSARRLDMMSSVEAPPFFSTDSSTPRWPSWRTMLVCGAKPSRTKPTSPMVVVAPLTVRIGRSLSAAMVSVEPLRRNVYSVAPNLAVPDGRIRFCTFSAATTSAGDRPRACIALVSRSIETSLDLPPYGNGIATPGMLTSCGRRMLTAASNTDCSGSVWLDRPSCTTGMLEAEYLITSGGVMPGGSCFNCACSIAVTCASAVWMLALGWKKILMTAMPGSVCDSMCSMSDTVVVRLRSFVEVMRWPISWADMPV